jgi:hypothetical protein
MQRELTSFAMLGEPRHIPNRMLSRLPVDPEEDRDQPLDQPREDWHPDGQIVRCDSFVGTELSRARHT